MSCKKMCKFFASELGSMSGVIRGFQKGITLGGRTSGSALKVLGGGWWVVACWITVSISLLSIEKRTGREEIDCDK